MKKTRHPDGAPLGRIFFSCVLRYVTVDVIYGDQQVEI